MDYHISLIDNFLSPLIHDLFLVRSELAHAHRLLLLVIVAQENLVLHKLQSRPSFRQNYLILHFLHLVKLPRELICDPFL